MWYVLIKEKSIFYKAISAVLPEQICCQTRTRELVCNSAMPLNAHYSVFRSWYYLTTQHTLKGNLYHKLRNTFWLCSGWRSWLPSNADQKSVKCFLRVVQNHYSRIMLLLESGCEAVSAQAAIPRSLPVPRSGVMTPWWVTGFSVSNNCQWNPEPVWFYEWQKVLNVLKWCTSALKRQLQPKTSSQKGNKILSKRLAAFLSTR